MVGSPDPSNVGDRGSPKLPSGKQKRTGSPDKPCCSHLPRLKCAPVLSTQYLVTRDSVIVQATTTQVAVATEVKTIKRRRKNVDQRRQEIGGSRSDDDARARPREGAARGVRVPASDRAGVWGGAPRV